MASSITYPANLPHLDQITDMIPDTLLRSPQDMGPAKVRRRYTYAPRLVSGTLLLTGQQRIEFDTFYGTTLAAGSLTFNWEDPRDDSPAEVRILSVSAFSLVRGGAVDERLWSTSITMEVLGAA